MTRLALRRGTVVAVLPAGDDRRRPVEVDVAGERRPAVSYERMTGPIDVGDDVVVNVAARDLGLGSGGFDVVHANLTRGLGGDGEPGAHIMKLNYTSMQHAVHPLELRSPSLQGRLRKPVAVLSLHGQLACVAWAAARVAPEARIGYVQTAGGSLAGGHSVVVRRLKERGLLAAHVTAAPAFDGDYEAISLCGAIHGGLTALGWDAVIAGPGPGVLGSATDLGHGGLAALDTVHGALALGCPTVVVPRMSASDPRPRHQGLSHHTSTVLDLLLRPVTVALPPGEVLPFPGQHRVVEGGVDLEGYRDCGLPVRTMGRDLDQDPLFFRAALAGGSVLGGEIRGV